MTCVYSADGICDNPKLNKGNGDARCHRFGNKQLLEILESAEDIGILEKTI